MSDAAGPDTSRRTRLDVRIEAADVDWAESESGPEGSFYSFGHVMEAAVTRVEDEFNFVAQRCRERGLTFDPAAYWKIHEPLIRASTPRPAGRPSASDKPDKRRAVGYVSTKRLEWVSTQAKPDGPFEPDQAAAHVLSFGIRILRACQIDSPVRSARFPFDGEPLWQNYTQNRKGLKP